MLFYRSPLVGDDTGNDIIPRDSLLPLDPAYEPVAACVEIADETSRIIGTPSGEDDSFSSPGLLRLLSQPRFLELFFDESDSVAAAFNESTLTFSLLPSSLPTPWL